MTVCYQIKINAYGDDENPNLFFQDEEMAEFVSQKLLEVLKKADADLSEFKVWVSEEVFIEKPKYLTIHKSPPKWLVNFIFMAAGKFLVNQINNKHKDN